MYQVYVLRSSEHGKSYIGYSKNAHNRLIQHNEGFVRSTKPYIPYVLIYTENFATRSEAMKREKKFKDFKNNQKLMQHLGIIT